MPTDTLDRYVDDDAELGPLSTGGAFGRARRRRLAALFLLGVVLVALVYVAYYYAQNRSLPSVRLQSQATLQDIQPPQYMYSFAGTGKDAMTLPTGIGVIGDRVYVTDAAYRTVRVYDTGGNHLFDFGPIRDGSHTALSSPVHIAVRSDGTVWVSDRTLGAIYVFDQNGTFLRKFQPNGDASFKWGPLAMAFGPAGDLYVTDVGDSAQHRVLVFDPKGHMIAHWGSTEQVSAPSQAPGKFLFPNGIAIDGTGTAALVYVADGDNRRVQVFHPDGTFVSVIDTSGAPRGLAVDAHHRLYVVDALVHRVDVYSSQGVGLATFGFSGIGPGGLSFPNDITINGAGRVFVTDRDNNQVQVWGWPVATLPALASVAPKASWAPLGVLAAALLVLGGVVARRRRFAVAPDFLDGMIAAELVPAMDSWRFKWYTTVPEADRYSGVEAQGVGLSDLLRAGEVSPRTAVQIRHRSGASAEAAALLAVAQGCRVLCTDDPVLARQAILLGIDVYDRLTWLSRFAKRRR
jgi:DNA-binding beta-propeller fold protein YncE